VIDGVPVWRGEARGGTVAEEKIEAWQRMAPSGGRQNHALFKNECTSPLSFPSTFNGSNYQTGKSKSK